LLAFQLLMLEQLPQLSETAATAISNIKFDKIVVWDGGQGSGSTAGFLRSMAGALPPMLHMMRDVGGVDMPDFLGKLVQEGRQGGRKRCRPNPGGAAQLGFLCAGFCRCGTRTGRNQRA